MKTYNVKEFLAGRQIADYTKAVSIKSDSKPEETVVGYTISPSTGEVRLTYSRKDDIHLTINEFRVLIKSIIDDIVYLMKDARNIGLGDLVLSTFQSLELEFAGLKIKSEFDNDGSILSASLAGFDKDRCTPIDKEFMKKKGKSSKGVDLYRTANRLQITALNKYQEFLESVQCNGDCENIKVQVKSFDPVKSLWEEMVEENLVEDKKDFLNCRFNDEGLYNTLFSRTPKEENLLMELVNNDGTSEGEVSCQVNYEDGYIRTVSPHISIDNAITLLEKTLSKVKDRAKSIQGISNRPLEIAYYSIIPSVSSSAFRHEIHLYEEEHGIFKYRSLYYDPVKREIKNSQAVYILMDPEDGLYKVSMGSMELGSLPEIIRSLKEFKNNLLKEKGSLKEELVKIRERDSFAKYIEKLSEDKN